MASLQVKVGLAFLAVYLIWGSTYLAIHVAEETLPPFFMAGTRFLIAGLILYTIVKLRGSTEKESKSQWSTALIVGGLMLLGGHGAVVWAEQWVPSGLVSLLIATVPLWIAFSEYFHRGTKPSLRVTGGLALGFGGVALLVSGLGNLGSANFGLIGGIVVVSGAFLWANGSLYSRSGKLPSSPWLATAMEMVAGGVLLLVASFAFGEWGHIRFDLVSAGSLAAWIYLILFGSLIGFTSYIWLLKNVQASRVSTYAYVNPVVALILGWTLLSETLTLLSAVAAVIVLASVIITTMHHTS